MKQEKQEKQSKPKKQKIFSGVEDLPGGRMEDGPITGGCLVLEGGAFRGVYGEGVLDYMMKAGIRMACVVGVSAGALNGMHYVSGQIGRSARLNLHYRHDSRYVGIKALPQNGGPIGFDFAFYQVPGDPLDWDAFMASPQRYVAVVTNCLTGETEYMEKGKCSDIARAIQASASMPYISKMVRIDGVPYLDGGCSTKIAYRWAMEQGYEHIVVVRTRPREWRYETSGRNQLPQRFYHAYPNLARALEEGKAKYNAACDDLDSLRSQRRVFVISPSQDLSVSRLESDMEKLGELYYLGWQDMEDNVKALKGYLKIQ